MKKEKKEQNNKSVGVLSCVIITIEFLIILSIVFVKMSGNIPNVFGYNIYSIVTGSMEPTLNVGDVIISLEYEANKANKDNIEIKEGDIITYHGQVGDLKGRIITHRVISIEIENGKKVITTKGDSNSSVDPVIDESCVISIMKYKTVVLSFVFKYINTIWGYVFLIVIPIVYMVSAEIYDYVKKNKEINEKDCRGDENEEA